MAAVPVPAENARPRSIHRIGGPGVGTFANAARWGPVMDTRRLVAYVLIVVLLAFLTGVWRYLTRERRAHYRAHRQFEQRKLDRLARDASS